MAVIISIIALIISGAKIIHDLGNNQESSETTSATIEMPMASQAVQRCFLAETPCRYAIRDLAIFQ